MRCSRRTGTLFAPATPHLHSQGTLWVSRHRCMTSQPSSAWKNTWTFEFGPVQLTFGGGFPFLGIIRVAHFSLSIYSLPHRVQYTHPIEAYPINHNSSVVELNLSTTSTCPFEPALPLTALANSLPRPFQVEVSFPLQLTGMIRANGLKCHWQVKKNRKGYWLPIQAISP